MDALPTRDLPARARGPAVREPGDRSFDAFYRAQSDRVYRALAVTLGDLQLAREAADEAMARAQVPGLATVAEAVTLPDGGFAALGDTVATEPLSSPGPAASRTPAADPDRLSLALVRPDGSERSLVDTAAIGLIGADDQRVFMYDGGGHIIGLDLATGRQQVLSWPLLHGGAVLAGGRFAELEGGPQGSQPTTCTLRLLDGRTGAQTSARSLPVADCSGWSGWQLSPDGRWLAVAEPGPMTGNINQLVVLLIDVDTGQQHSQVLDQGPAVADSGQISFQGLAWLDDERVRIVWTRLPDHVDRMYDKSEVLRMATVTVPGG